MTTIPARTSSRAAGSSGGVALPCLVAAQDTVPAVNPGASPSLNSAASEGVWGFSVAALFVETGGSYYGLPGVDPWDETRDARKYAGPWPVVAHPPCQRWGKFWAGQPAWIARTGERKVKGDDGGCFAAALASLREWGGVLEHPWGSHAWPHFGLNVPPRDGGWIAADLNGYVPDGHRGGWTCCVEQGRYGHYSRKPTLLLVYGLEFRQLPQLRWGVSEPSFPQWAIDRYGLAKCKRAGELAFKGGGKDNKHRIGTPPEFRDLLIGIARSVPHPGDDAVIRGRSDTGSLMRRHFSRLTFRAGVTPRAIGNGSARSAPAWCGCRAGAASRNSVLLALGHSSRPGRT